MLRIKETDELLGSDVYSQSKVPKEDFEVVGFCDHNGNYYSNGTEHPVGHEHNICSNPNKP